MSNEISAEDLPTRWEIELEFVQSLANMQYLTYLAQTGHLENPQFLNYIDYLQYWHDPKYSKNLIYPNCLHILTLLKSPHFRSSISKQELSSLIYQDMVDRWKEPLFEQQQQQQEQQQKLAAKNGGFNNTDQDNKNGETPNQNAGKQNGSTFPQQQNGDQVHPQ
ncbi:unnamed protein product [Ambrosiozyma monospora]|uniref:Mediator of RNA polymerase II transcription subunit 31 n=1 Tax=Ambrosiozyma monospora TaxID=43982 RepID=A0A9W6YPI3_AMBMO|nr:unnamed protein product [Ambrosiozyma monospora]